MSDTDKVSPDELREQLEDRHGVVAVDCWEPIEDHNERVSDDFKQFPITVRSGDSGTPLFAEVRQAGWFVAGAYPHAHPDRSGCCTTLLVRDVPPQETVPTAEA